MRSSRDVRRTLTVAGVWAVVVVMLMMGGFSLAGPATVPRPGSGIASERTGAPVAALPHGASSTTHVATTAVRDIHAAEYSPRAPSRSMATSTAASPGCSSQPCPMGITDYGVTPSLGSYTYRTNEVESFVDISTLHVNQSNGASCLDGNAAWCMGFQSNWVTEGVKVHNVAHDYWTQDVAQVAYDSSCSSPCVSGTYSVTWLDNIWNFSSATGALSANAISGHGSNGGRLGCAFA